jgi:ribonuclease VapC
VILDTSAIMAMLQEEPEAPAMEEALAAASAIAIAAPGLVEAYLVCEGRAGEKGARQLDALLERLGSEIVPFTAEHAALAREGWRRYGKGRHPAGLNMGDCFAYALAKARHQPLLFKGDDFAQTDVKAAI